MTDTLRWRRFIMGRSTGVAVQIMNDSVQFYSSKTDTVEGSVMLSNDDDSARNAEFAYSFPGRNELMLRGRWMGDSIRVTLKRFNTDRLLLVRRGFHWINEWPENE
jgi:hypothetical protein